MTDGIWRGESCPGCGGDLRLLGFFRCLREDDGKRVCRTPVRCVVCDRVWSRWADRDEPLTEDPIRPPRHERSN
jgi:hypothetical protein